MRLNRTVLVALLLLVSIAALVGGYAYVRWQRSGDGTSAGPPSSEFPWREMPAAIAVSLAGTTPKLAVDEPWPMVLPGAPVEWADTPERYVSTAGESRLVVAKDEFTLTLNGVPVFVGQDQSYPIMEGKAAGETGAVPASDTVLQQIVDARGHNARRWIRFSECAAHIDSEVNVVPGLRFDQTFLKSHPIRLGDDRELVTNLPSLVEQEGGSIRQSALAIVTPDRTYNVVAAGGMRLNIEGDAVSAAQTPWLWYEDGGYLEPPWAERLHVYALPVERRPLYTATLTNGQVSVTIGGRDFLVSDVFYVLGFQASQVFLGGYFRGNEGREVGYLFRAPLLGFDSLPFAKSLLLTDNVIQTEWVWRPWGGAGQAACQLAPETIIGCRFAAEGADGGKTVGVLTDATVLDAMRRFQIHVGDVVVTFLSDGPNLAFDGRRARMVISDDGEPATDMRHGRLIIRFAKEAEAEE